MQYSDSEVVCMSFTIIKLSLSVVLMSTKEKR